MNAYHITGGNQLSGSVRVQGAKNSVLPILAASVLSEGECVIRNCPELLDVESSIRILKYLGCGADGLRDNTLTVNAAQMSRCDIPDGLMREMRSSVVFLGAILSRAGEAVMSYPGGCDLGPRPIDMHISSLKQLGAEIHEEGGMLICSTTGFVGCDIQLPAPSVGATENIMLAGARAKGTTRIFNAAREPEIEDLQTFINAMGGRISGAGSSTVTIEGTERLSGAEHRVIPDRIVTSTLLAATASAGGDVLLTGTRPGDLASVIAVLTEAGCIIEEISGPESVCGTASLRVRRKGALRSMRRIRTMPHPGFPTDAQAPVMAVACVADGTTVFSESIFESRFRHAGELLRMGADIRTEGHVAVVCGVPKLYGADVEATDLRGGAALVVAALAAEGNTVVRELRHIDRGYDSFEQTLAALGADIKRV